MVGVSNLPRQCQVPISVCSGTHQINPAACHSKMHRWVRICCLPSWMAVWSLKPPHTLEATRWQCSTKVTNFVGPSTRGRARAWQRNVVLLCASIRQHTSLGIELQSYLCRHFAVLLPIKAGLQDNVPDRPSARVAPVGCQLANMVFKMKTDYPKKWVARQKLSPNQGRQCISGLSCTRLVDFLPPWQ